LERGVLELLGIASGPAVLGFAVFLRVGAAMALLPGFGEQAVPLRVRLILAVVLSFVVWPMVSTKVPHLSGIPPVAYATETIIGLALGAFFRLFVVVLQVAGMMAAQSTSLSQIFGGGATPDPMPAFGNLLVIGGLALAMITGLHVRLAAVLVTSYDAMPLGQFPGGAELMAWGVSGVSSAFGLAFSLAAPFVIASLVYNVALGAINKAMPQLMVAFVGAPAITLGGLVLLTVMAPFILSLWLEHFHEALSTPFGEMR